MIGGVAFVSVSSGSVPSRSVSYPSVPFEAVVSDCGIVGAVMAGREGKVVGETCSTLKACMQSRSAVLFRCSPSTADLRGGDGLLTFLFCLRRGLSAQSLAVVLID